MKLAIAYKSEFVSLLNNLELRVNYNERVVDDEENNFRIELLNKLIIYIPKIKCYIFKILDIL